MLIIRPLGLLMQVVRGAMITALSSAYVKTARAKGVRERAVIFIHALRNAMLPVITVAGDQATALVNGAVVVETIFGFPGIGKLMIDGGAAAGFRGGASGRAGHRDSHLRHEHPDRPRLCDARSAHPARLMASDPAIDAPALPPIERPWRQVFLLLWRDKFAFVAALFLLVMIFCALFGPALLGDVATKMDLKQRNAPPFELDRGWLFILGADALGRSILARIIVASQNTLAVAGAAVVASR